MPQPWTRHEAYRDALVATVGSGAQVGVIFNDGPSPWASWQSGSYVTTAGSPAGDTTNPCFLNEDESPQEYLKCDPGDQVGLNYDPYHLRVGLFCWCRLDALPVADTFMVGMNTGDWVGVNTSGQVYASRGGTVQGTEDGTRVLGEWFHVAKMNDADGAGTGARLWVNGVGKAITVVGGTGADNIRLGATNFDGAFSHYNYWDVSTSTGTDANVKLIYEAGARKVQRRVTAFM